MRQEFNLPDDRFRHVAFFYAGDDAFLRGTLPFIEEGLQIGEAVLVVETPDKRRILRASLGANADKVQFADMEDVGANPAHIIPAWQEFVSQSTPPGRALRGIGEPIWAGRHPDEVSECQWHESLLNVAFCAGRPWTLLCPYDVDHLDAALVDEARRSHEWVLESGAVGRSAEYRGIESSAGPFSAPLPAAPRLASKLTFEARNLGAVRATVSAYALTAGLDRAGVARLVTAANEVATNSVCHGGGGGSIRLWSARGKIVCEVRDHGLFDRPLVDRELPGADASASRGLWLANQLCDLVQTRTFHDETVVRLHMALRPRRGLSLMPSPTAVNM